MLTALFALCIGWLLGLIGLDYLLNAMMGLTQQGYYICWFVTGGIVWVVNLVKRKAE